MEVFLRRYGKLILQFIGDDYVSAVEQEGAAWEWS